MMDHHANRNLRGLVASAIFAAMLGLGGGTVSATPVLVDFDSPPKGPRRTPGDRS